MARCPSCDDTLTATLHEQVSLDLCNGCGGVWATHDQLEELRGGRVVVKLFTGKTKHRCATCRVELERARLDDRIDVEACGACEGVFLPEGQLTNFAPPSKKQTLKPSRTAGMFSCVKCHKSFPLGQGTILGSSLACRACAGLDGPAGAKADEEAGQAFVDWLSRHRLVVFAVLGVVLMLCVVGVEVAWENFLGRLLDTGAKK